MCRTASSKQPAERNVMKTSERLSSRKRVLIANISWRGGASKWHVSLWLHNTRAVVPHSKKSIRSSTVQRVPRRGGIRLESSSGMWPLSEGVPSTPTASLAACTDKRYTAAHCKTIYRMCCVAGTRLAQQHSTRPSPACLKCPRSLTLRGGLL